MARLDRTNQVLLVWHGLAKQPAAPQPLQAEDRAEPPEQADQAEPTPPLETQEAAAAAQ